MKTKNRKRAIPRKQFAAAMDQIIADIDTGRLTPERAQLIANVRRIDAAKQKPKKQKPDPAETLREVVAVLSGRSWDADTPCDIAAILERAGHKIKGIDD